MYNIEPYTPRVQMLFRDGRGYEFPSVVEALAYAHAYGLLGGLDGSRRIGDAFGKIDSLFNPCGYPDIVFQTEHGEPIEVSWAAWKRHRPKLKPDRQPQRFSGAKSRWRFRHFYRRPSTQAVVRAMVASADDALDEGLQLEWIGRNRALPNAWDDIPRSRHASRNWKHYRARQWKD